MVDRYSIAIKVISQQGYCLAGHKVGDEWLIEYKENKWKTPAEGICPSGFNSLYPNLRVLEFGGVMSEAAPDILQATCPDSRNPVIFELRRIRPGYYTDEHRDRGITPGL